MELLFGDRTFRTPFSLFIFIQFKVYSTLFMKTFKTYKYRMELYKKQESDNKYNVYVLSDCYNHVCFPIGQINNNNNNNNNNNGNL